MSQLMNWKPPSDWMTVSTVDSHAAGEPFRVITGGVPIPEGRSILERRRWARENLDPIRRLLMWEPRGHADMYGGLIVPPQRSSSDFGVLFLHNEGFSTMCGHGIIAVTTVVLETGMHPAEAGVVHLQIDAPAGQIAVEADFNGNRVDYVRFINVPAFVQTLGGSIEVPALGTIAYDLAFGGAFYAFVDAEALGLELVPVNARILIETGMTIKQAVAEQDPPLFPGEPDLSFLYGTIFVGAPHSPENHSRNVCIFADGELDRCPTGTGVSARLAIHHRRGELTPGEWITVESILGTEFQGRLVELSGPGPEGSILPQIQGSAFITGVHQFTVDPRDPLSDGFLIR